MSTVQDSNRPGSRRGLADVVVVPVDETVVGRKAEEAETLAAIVRNAVTVGRSEAVIAIRST